jgi:hypothetical protein
MYAQTVAVAVKPVWVDEILAVFGVCSVLYGVLTDAPVFDLSKLIDVLEWASFDLPKAMALPFDLCRQFVRRKMKNRMLEVMKHQVKNKIFRVPVDELFRVKYRCPSDAKFSLIILNSGEHAVPEIQVEPVLF